MLERCTDWRVIQYDDEVYSTRPKKLAAKKNAPLLKQILGPVRLKFFTFA